MKKTAILTFITISLLIMLVTAGCGLIVIAEPPGAAGQEAQTAQLEGVKVVRGGEKLEISMKDNKFDPANAEVKTGTVITFINNDSVTHHVKAEAEAFESGDLEPGQKWTTVISNPGEYPYSCSLHPEMNGVITVK
ncbi:MAG: cupredoxin domain-containing protein [Actinobacteria bacterium]|nr:cupredoxin domain-containing protein [Actinomycetota bacterium]